MRTEQLKRVGETLGGSEIESWDEYVRNEAIPYFNKKDHLSRSVVHQPNHLKMKPTRRGLIIDRSTYVVLDS